MNESIPLPAGLKEAENLTGQVSLDANNRQFWGSYSCVYLGEYRGELIAAKVIKEIRTPGNPDSTSTTKRKLKREMTVWATMNHPNIQPLYGFAEDQTFLPFGALISPWCTKGDAAHFLSEHGENMLVAERIRLWKGVIDGVVYLHGHDPIIVHGDLKPGNILIDDTRTPKICDFGLSQIVLDQGSSGMTTTSEHTGTTRYLAPELVNSDVSVPPTVASDIYALGCLGLEFVYLRQPFANHKDNTRGQIFKDLRQGLPPSSNIPPHQWPAGHAWSLMTRLWNSNPSMRPSAFTAAHLLKRASFTFPPPVLKNIVAFVDAMADPYSSMSELAQYHRIYCLRTLCSVSKAIRAQANPLLYKHIDLVARSQDLPAAPWPSFWKLVRTIQSSAKDTVDGYGSYTKTIVLSLTWIREHQFLHSLPTGLSELISLMPGIQVIHICRPEILGGRGMLSFHALTKLDISGTDISFLLDNVAAIRVLSCLQCLCIRQCYGSTQTQEQPPLYTGLVLPVLQQVLIYGTHPSESGAQNEIFKAMAGWVIPYLDLLHVELASTNNNLLPVLAKHGGSLRHILVDVIPAEVGTTANLLELCPALQSLHICVKHDDILDKFPPHEALETITFKLLEPLNWEDLGNVLNFKQKTSGLPRLECVELSLFVERLSDSERAIAVFHPWMEYTLLTIGEETYRFYDGEKFWSEMPPHASLPPPRFVRFQHDDEVVLMRQGVESRREAPVAMQRLPERSLDFGW